jgi:dipeptidase E
LDLKNPSLGFIPSTGDKEGKYFDQVKAFYKKFGIKKFTFFDLDQAYEESKTTTLINCQIIHLSGGDPIFLHDNIKERNFGPILHKFVRNNGILIGVSGGACNIGKNIALYRLFSSSIEETLKIRNELIALNFGNFEFLPHFNRWDRLFKTKVLEYSKRILNKIYACHDGDGIILNGKNLELFGDVLTIENGVILSKNGSPSNEIYV